jgi:hypothetical protein
MHRSKHIVKLLTLLSNLILIAMRYISNTLQQIKPLIVLALYIGVYFALQFMMSV